MRPLSASFLLPSVSLLGVFAVACAAPAVDGDASEAQAAATVDQLAQAGITLHVQAPIPAVPGQALRVVDGQGGARSAEVLPKACVTDEGSSTLAVNGGQGLGMSAGHFWSLRRGGGGVGFGHAISEVDERPLMGVGGDWRAPVELAAVRSFVAAQSTKPGRASGTSSSVVMRNAFFFKGNTRRSGTGDACGNRWVSVVETARFLAVSAVLDFPTPEDSRAFATAFGRIDAILDPTPELTTYLREHQTKLSFHVLVSKELSGWISAKLTGAACTLDRLDRCSDAIDRIHDAAGDLGALPGNDDTLEAVTGASPTWGIYGITSADYAQVDALTSP